MKRLLNLFLIFLGTVLGIAIFSMVIKTYLNKPTIEREIEVVENYKKTEKDSDKIIEKANLNEENKNNYYRNMEDSYLKGIDLEDKESFIGKDINKLPNINNISDGVYFMYFKNKTYSSTLKETISEYIDKKEYQTYIIYGNSESEFIRGIELIGALKNTKIPVDYFDNNVGFFVKDGQLVSELELKNLDNLADYLPSK